MASASDGIFNFFDPKNILSLTVLTRKGNIGFETLDFGIDRPEDGDRVNWFVREVAMGVW